MKYFYFIIACFFSFTGQSQEATTTIYLIRHAEKADDTSDTDLSEKGNLRAQRWAAYFKPMRIQTFYTTNYKRSVSTIIPASVAAVEPVPGTTYNMKIIRYDPGTLSLLDVASKHNGEKVLIVGHSNTIPNTINKYLGKEVYKDIPEDEYGNLYIITINGNKVSHDLVKI